MVIEWRCLIEPVRLVDKPALAVRQIIICISISHGNMEHGKDRLGHFNSDDTTSECVGQVFFLVHFPIQNFLHRFEQSYQM